MLVQMHERSLKQRRRRPRGRARSPVRRRPSISPCSSWSQSVFSSSPSLAASHQSPSLAAPHRLLSLVAPQSLSSLAAAHSSQTLSLSASSSSQTDLLGSQLSSQVSEHHSAQVSLSGTASLKMNSELKPAEPSIKEPYLDDDPNHHEGSKLPEVDENGIRAGKVKDQLSRKLEEQGKVTDKTQGRRIQALAWKSDHAVMTAGPDVFLSPTGLNPLMYQSQSFVAGTGTGAFSLATVSLKQGQAAPGVTNGAGSKELIASMPLLELHTDEEKKAVLTAGYETIASILLFDPIQQLLAIGTTDGRLKVVGGKNIGSLMVWELENKHSSSILKGVSNIPTFFAIYGIHYTFMETKDDDIQPTGRPPDNPEGAGNVEADASSLSKPALLEETVAEAAQGLSEVLMKAVSNRVTCVLVGGSVLVLDLIIADLKTSDRTVLSTDIDSASMIPRLLCRDCGRGRLCGVAKAIALIGHVSFEDEHTASIELDIVHKSALAFGNVTGIGEGCLGGNWQVSAEARHAALASSTTLFGSAGDDSTGRDLDIGQDSILPLLVQSNEHSEPCTLRNAAGTLSSFWQGKPTTPFAWINAVLPVLHPFIHMKEEEVWTYI